MKTRQQSSTNHHATINERKEPLFSCHPQITITKFHPFHIPTCTLFFQNLILFFSKFKTWQWSYHQSKQPQKIIFLKKTNLKEKT